MKTVKQEDMVLVKIEHNEYAVPMADARNLMALFPKMQKVDMKYYNKIGYISFIRDPINVTLTINHRFVNVSGFTDDEYSEYRSVVDAAQTMAEGSQIIDPTTWKETKNEVR